jgi:sugar phosphate isomerase/epimerase
MKLNQIALQLYTCRDLLRDSAGFAKTLKRLSEAGYTAVELAGLGPISPAEFNGMLEDNGMTCCSMHHNPQEILSNPEKVVEMMDALHCSLAAYPYPADIDLSSEKSVAGLVEGLRKAGELFARTGKTLCYHNHNHEFRKLNGKTILELIYEGAGGAVQGELDTYWVQYGGSDNVEWCEKLSGRLPIIHLKDYYTTSENKPQECEIGAGVLDFKRIVHAAEKAGCQWFVVEQDNPPGDAVDSLAQSFRYIAENLIS